MQPTKRTTEAKARTRTPSETRKAVKKFKTAVAQRGGLLEFELETIRYDSEGDPVDVDDDGKAVPFEATFRVDPDLDVTSMGALFAEMIEVSLTLSDLKPDRAAIAAEGLPEDPKERREMILNVQAESGEKLAAALPELEARMSEARARLRSCLIPPDREIWDTVASSIDLETLMDFVTWIMRELSPDENPT